MTASRGTPTSRLRPDDRLDDLGGSHDPTCLLHGLRHPLGILRIGRQSLYLPDGFIQHRFCRMDGVDRLTGPETPQQGGNAWLFVGDRDGGEPLAHPPDRATSPGGLIAGGWRRKAFSGAPLIWEAPTDPGAGASAC